MSEKEGTPPISPDLMRALLDDRAKELALNA